MTDLPAAATKPAPCGFPVGGAAACGADAVAQAPWNALHGYADRVGLLPLCPLHALRFPDAARL